MSTPSVSPSSTISSLPPLDLDVLELPPAAMAQTTAVVNNTAVELLQNIPDELQPAAPILNMLQHPAAPTTPPPFAPVVNPLKLPERNPTRSRSHQGLNCHCHKKTKH